MLKEIKGSEI